MFTYWHASLQALLAAAVGFGARAGDEPCSYPIFSSPQTFVDIHSEVTAIAVGDMDRDGLQDIVALHWHFGVSDVSVLLNNGGGRFITHDFVDSPAPAFQVILADLNGDEYLDAISFRQFESDPGEITIFLNEKDGRLSPGTIYEIGDRPWSVAAGDINGDGFTDLLTANVLGTVSVLINVGNGTFALRGVLGVAPPARSIQLTDVDNDSDLDFVVLGGHERLFLFTNDSMGTFRIGGTWVVPDPSSELVVVDVENDGDTDAIAVGQNALMVFANDGSDFRLHQHVPTGFGRITSVITHDIDADGYSEVLAAANTQSRLLIFPNRNGTFGLIDVRALDVMDSLQCTNLDNDEQPDLAFVSSSRHPIIGLQLSSGQWLEQPALFSESWWLAELAGADFNGDSRVDLFMRGASDSDFVTLENIGDGTFRRRDVGEGFLSTYDAVVGDFNTDGLDDVVITEDFERPLHVYLNDGTGGFHPPRQVHGIPDLSELAAGDVDQDGDLDLALSSNQYDEYKETYTHRLVILANDGTGSFTRRSGKAFDEFGFLHAFADVDHDEDLDIVFYRRGIHWMSNDGSGQFTDGGQLIRAEQPVRSFQFSDIDLDGDADALITADNDLLVSMNLGSGLFADPVIYDLPRPHREHQWAAVGSVVDVDGDRWPDVLLASSPTDNMILLRNDGTGGLFDAVFYGAGAFALDIDGDGDADSLRLWGEPYQQELWIVLNTCHSFHGVELTAFTIVRGSLVEGTLESLRERDGDVLIVNSEPDPLITQPNVLDVRIFASALRAGPRLQVRVTSRIDHPSGAASVRLRNWSTGELDRVHEYQTGFTDRSVITPPVDAAPHVRPGDGLIEVSIKEVVIATFAVSGFQSSIDHIGVEIALPRGN